ncbi:MAG: glycoside hydrolase family 20 zincin-like fold domain-containing protein [Cyclobacteriaceae bacterium]|nr:glycoside hydrolase family 20 zincin-like fold domain-containing protein [Cyclobacteriaceae bacterium]
MIKTLVNSLRKGIFFRLVFTVVFVTTILSGCSESPEKVAGGLQQVQVKWELLANTFGEGEGSEVQFIFVNNGANAVHAGNWFMEYNSDNVLPKAMADSTKGIVEHVNGYLFRFTPGKDFVINPGDSLVYKYSCTGPFLKTWAGPVGGYFVIDNGTASPLIVQPSPISLLGFDDLERVFPIPDIRATVPNAANTYEKNLSVIPLSTEKIGKIIPTPFRPTKGKGTVVLGESTVINFSAGLENEANYLVSTVEKLFGVRLQAVEGNSPATNSINLAIAPLSVNGVSSEAYHLTVAEGKGVKIRGSDAAGVFTAYKVF